MAAGDRSFPFDDGNANEPEFREMFGPLGDGILDDLTGTSFRATVNTASQEVTIAPGRGRSAGAVLTGPNNEVLPLNTTGQQPTSGQTRVDFVVLRTDYALNKVVRALTAGNPAATGQQQPATLARNPAGVWEVPLWRVTRSITGAGATIALTDERVWVGPRLSLAPTAELPAAALGSAATRAGLAFRREPNAQGNPAWIAEGAWEDYTPQWLSSSGATSVGVGGQLAGRWCWQGRTVHFQMRWLLGSPSAGGAPDSTWRFTLPTPAATPNVFNNNVGHVGMKNRGIWLAGLAHRHSAIPDAFTVIAHNQAQAIGPLNPNGNGWVAGDEMRVNGTYEVGI